MIKLVPTREFKVPIFAPCISPTVLQGKTLEEIRQLEVWEGNRKRVLGDLFRVEETETKSDSDDLTLIIEGDVSKVRMIGAGMVSGEIIVKGDVGMHLGEEMEGGKITVYGNVGGWAGSMMKGGLIEIHGNVDDFLAAPYRGQGKGMSGGTIIVYGDVGREAGAYMRKGLIKIYGNADQFVGYAMQGGTIYVQKNSGANTAACMVNGTVIIGGRIDSVLPSFTIDGIKNKVKVDENEVIKAPFYLFIGDLAENGKGKLYVSKENNPHLSYYERFL
ncbi:MAG: formylmethanofuran dehydrogenase subunit C [Candidatus Bathyarchaeia archaeon]